MHIFYNIPLVCHRISIHQKMMKPVKQQSHTMKTKTRLIIKFTNYRLTAICRAISYTISIMSHPTLFTYMLSMETNAIKAQRTSPASITLFAVKSLIAFCIAATVPPTSSLQKYASDRTWYVGGKHKQPHTKNNHHHTTYKVDV